MKSSVIFFIFTLFVLTKAGLIHHSDNNENLQQELTSGEHHENDLDSLLEDDSTDLEECICGEDDDEDDAFEGSNSTRVKRCGCGYGYCGCTAPAAPAAGGGAGGNGGGGPKNVFVVPFPMPAPAPPQTPAPPSQTIVLPPQTQLPPHIPQQPYIPSQSLLTGSGGNACDRLRLILTLTNQLEGLKLTEIAGQCVVQIEK